VRGLVHRRPVAEADEQVAGDLGDDAALERAAAGIRAVLHLAARTHARRAGDYAEANAAGTRRLLEAAQRAGVVRFVHVSTRAIGARGGAYSESKRAAEALVRKSRLDWTIIRLPEVYGAGGGEGVDRIIAAARRGAPIPLVGAGQDEVCPIHRDDAVAALVAALDAPAASRRVYTLAGDCTTLRGFADACVEELGGGRVICVPVGAVRVLAAAARVTPLPLYPDQLARLRAPKPPGSPEARADLGFHPRPLREGLRSYPFGP
jgi:NADH dehydrogenase